MFPFDPSGHDHTSSIWAPPRPTPLSPLVYLGKVSLFPGPGEFRLRGLEDRASSCEHFTIGISHIGSFQTCSVATSWRSASNSRSSRKL